MELPQLGTRYLYEAGTQLMDCMFPKPEDCQGNRESSFVVYVCANCGYPNIARYSQEGDVDFDNPEEWIPASSIGKKYSDVPKTVANAASEAYKCFSIGAYLSLIHI